MNKDIDSLLKSFTFAFKGIAHCVRNERNMRIHLVAGSYALFFSRFYDLSRAEKVLLFVSIAMVISAEMLNTAIEALIDFNVRAYDDFARVAKDVAAGAVLLCAALSVVVGLIIFWDPAMFFNILSVIFGSFINILLLFFSFAAAAVFVFESLHRPLLKRLKRLRK